MTVSRYWSAAGAAALALIFLPTLAREGTRAATPPGPYVLTDLGTLGGLSSQAYDLNETAQVTGYATTPASQGHAFLWDNGVMTDLRTLGGPFSVGQAINNVGQIAGYSTLVGNQNYHATLWENGAIIDLAPGYQYSTANGINNAGEVVGTINHTVGFLWQNGVITNLGHLGGGYSNGADINSAGQVVGSSVTPIVTELGPMPHAFLWQNGVMTDLGVLPGEEDSGAAAINSVGQIVGSSGRTDPETYEVNSRSFLYQNGVMSALPVPSSESSAGDINDSGVVVGAMRAAGGFSNRHAYIYADGVVTNLNSLIPSGSGLHLAWAQAINNAGQIAGVAYDAQARYHAFLLTPVASGTPVVNIGDASITEGHTGTRSASFNVTLSRAASQAVTVSYSSANGSASAGSDYQSTSGAVTFGAGQTTATISVVVNGDRVGEPNETFMVNLGQVTGGAVIADGQGSGTIVDDEPRVSVNDVSKNEGHSGSTQFVFTVSLSSSPGPAISLNFATANGSARSGEDYTARSGSLTFNAGETTKTVTVTVTGDRRREGNEVFNLNLSVAAGAFIVDNQGDGVIRNDD